MGYLEISCHFDINPSNELSVWYLANMFVNLAIIDSVIVGICLFDSLTQNFGICCMLDAVINIIYSEEIIFSSTATIVSIMVRTLVI